MEKRVIAVWVCLFCAESLQEYQDYEDILRGSHVTLRDTFFPPLFNFQTNATKISETKYKWVARVVLSRRNNRPYMCTASCIQPRIFITSARCIIGLSTYYAKIIFNNVEMMTLAFVTPTVPTKQRFDDVGFIVTEDVGVKTWKAVDMFHLPNRTDETYQWFSNVTGDSVLASKVIGYAQATKMNVENGNENADLALFEIDVQIKLNTCRKIFSYNNLIAGYYVPCYLPCTVQDFNKLDGFCPNYLAAEGSAVLSKQKGKYKLLGVSTWGTQFSERTLPIGFAIPNTDNFQKNLKCAELIRNYKLNDTSNLTLGFFQDVCDKNEK